MSLAAAGHRGRAVLTGLRARHEWADHLVRTVLRYHERHGNHFAAAITFFSILNAVPLLMVALAAAGYLLWFNPEILAAVEAGITGAVPDELADTVEPVIETAIEQRNTVAGVGLVAALWAGTWWMSNLREAVSAQWAIPPRNPASLRRLLSDLLALVGLWIALVASLLVTAIGTGLGETVLRLAGWQGADWTQLTRFTLGLLLGLAADWLIFFWIITRLPRTRGPVHGAVRAALLGAVGLEVLRHALTIYLGQITGSPGGAVFGSLLGLLVFAYLVSRFVLLVTAWAATVPDNLRPEPEPEQPPVVVHAATAPGRAGPGSGVAAAVAGAMLVGVLVGTRLHHGRRGPR
ncbi:YhjD/YihY/BrkB family envelope integrity protein [Pseudonocardia lacus]|uniref:YhjD/YihY/BrkB family envelope integrity protein n=1 Tax=Pseudonocardia lacus TaxID=2835865 RepID=UPI001BDD8DF0|nr:YhjD/YihY/BrkB family envelope integrity protein [Pseudonocardia lacus]